MHLCTIHDSQGQAHQPAAGSAKSPQLPFSASSTGNQARNVQTSAAYLVSQISEKKPYARSDRFLEE